MDEAQDPKRRPKLFSSSLYRGIQILEAFEHGYQPMSLSELVTRTGLEKTAVQRFTATLVMLGLLEKDPTTRRYLPSPGLLRIGSRFLRGNPLIERATPYMLAVNHETGMTVNLGVMHEDAIILAARLPGNVVVSPNVGLGSSFPWYVASLGQAIVAHLPHAESERLVSTVEFQQYATGTIMTHDALRRKLEEVRRTRIAVSFNATYEGDISIAAPVFDAQAQVSSAVSLNTVRPAGQLAGDEMAALVQTISNLARSISSTHPWE